MERLKSKISEKTILLMQAFQKHNSLCIQDIMQTLECNRQSAYNYLNHLEKMGVQLHRTTQDRKTYFSIISENTQKTEPLSYLPVTGKPAAGSAPWHLTDWAVPLVCVSIPFWGIIVCTMVWIWYVLPALPFTRQKAAVLL